MRLAEQICNTLLDATSTVKPLATQSTWQICCACQETSMLQGQGNKQKENFGLPFDPPKPKADLQQQQDKIKSERQINFEKTKQLKSAKNEQNRKEKEQRQKQKEREKDGKRLIGISVRNGAMFVTLSQSQS